MLRLEDAGRCYGTSWAVRSVSLTIRDGEFLVLLGPSGAGKSTLIRLISGVERPDTGRILLDDLDLVSLPPERRPVATMWQSLNLFPHLDVLQNVSFGLRARGWGRQAAHKRASELLRIVELGGYERRSIMSLSGGEQQRVALVRCLAVEPRVLLLDEPLGSLDERLRYDLMLLLRRLHRETKTTFLMVTHRLREALACADSLAVMFEGCIESIGTAKHVYSEPTAARVATFLGRNNVFVVREARCLDNMCRVDTELGVLAAERWAAASTHANSFYAVRPGEIRILALDDSVPSKWNAVEVILEQASYEGECTRLHLLNGSTRIEAEIRNQDRSPSLVLGRRYRASWPASAAFCRIPERLTRMATTGLSC